MLDRIHVLEGRMIVLLNVDKVIKIIRNADDPKAELIKAFKLSERQADDILDIRLRQLAKLEHIKIEQELKDLQKEQKGLEKILKDRKALEDLVVSEIEEDVKTFGDKRRTRIEESEKAVIETPVIDEPVTVIFSKKGWVRARQGWEVDPATLSFKEGDSLLALIKCRTVDPVIFLDSKGRAYTVEAAQLPPARGDGVPASSLVEVQDGAHILYCARRQAGNQGAGRLRRRLRLPVEDRRHDLQPQGGPRVHDVEEGRHADRALRIRRLDRQFRRRAVRGRAPAAVPDRRTQVPAARPRHHRDGPGRK